MAQIHVTDLDPSDSKFVEPINSTTAQEELLAQFDELSDEDLQYIVGGGGCITIIRTDSVVIQICS